MSGIARISTCVSPPPSRRRRATSLTSDELNFRRLAGDFSHLAPHLLGSDRPHLSVPDYDKDLPRIPSTSTGLWGGEAVTVFTDRMGSHTTSPIVGCPPPTPSYHVYERIQITEAQRIADQYRERRRSSIDVAQGSPVSEQATPSVNIHSPESLRAFPSSTVIRSGVSTDTQATNTPVKVALAPQSPTIHALAEETETTHTSHEGVSLFSRVHEDGTVSCTRGDCLTILPSLRAFLSHLHIHLIHEGLNSCELCGVWFTDDDHKDDHLNSCPKLPTFHKIGSLESKPSGSLHGFLSRFRR
ncbi:hypothetical protein BDM02DRAFT_3269203 [Thelephora ganbajun]|uniref:Uncharacterized protein n=1 Tax=Thelephora ganbajun TaxID=370292 RepID=A0ACB6ZHC8_THEGA|nr:hypothetical protein BDM02DRAFT_3269203 [Thelephora ganbajun]